MFEKSNQTPLKKNKDVVLLIKGLIIGKVLTLLVIGGLLWWLKPQLWSSATATNQTSENPVATTNGSTYDRTTGVPSGTFNYGGSAAWIPIRQVVDAQIQQARPELQLRYIQPPNGNLSSSVGIQMLLDGKLDFAHSSRPLTAAEKALAQKQGLTLAEIPIAMDGIAAVVHPSLQISGLTVEQLQQIYQGKITNWSQLGGENLPIVPYTRHPQDGSPVAIFSTSEQAFGTNVRSVNSTTAALRLVNQTPGAIYYASARAVVHQCGVKPIPLGENSDRFVAPYREPLSQPCPNQRHQPNLAAFADGSYPLTRNLYAIVKQDGGRAQQAGEAYTKLLLSDQGQQAIRQAGFVQAAASTAQNKPTN
ncbi:phosphate ABC transporter substrate-binding protein [Cyanosarcina cf. burmensis CCALA 770]|nr:phosphate ABC transporter substrate-binding protein [Cyanosarcina cf. burmensis CCALA 770]